MIAHCTSIIRSLCSAPSLCLSCRAQQHSSFIASQVLPVALQHPVLHDELPVRQLHLAPAGVHAADLRVPLHLQLCSHLQHHVPRVAAHLLLLWLRRAQPLQPRYSFTLSITPSFIHDAVGFGSVYHSFFWISIKNGKTIKWENCYYLVLYCSLFRF